jgi:hypothetical protein
MSRWLRRNSIEILLSSILGVVSYIAVAVFEIKSKQESNFVRIERNEQDISKIQNNIFTKDNVKEFRNFILINMQDIKDDIVEIKNTLK